MRATAIIPVKRFARAKQRLLGQLDPRERAAVVSAMLADVLAAVVEAEAVERVIVVTGERRAERIALERAKRSSMPIEILRDPDDRGHSEAATLGIVRAMALGATASALLPGDCPLLDPAELDAALTELAPAGVAVVPDRHGTGTNGLLLSPADAIGPAFGEGSAARHLDRARRAGLEASLVALPSLALDLDTPDDLAALSTAVGAEPGRSPETAAALERLGGRADTTP